jgi:hypothetical protein
MATDLSQCQPQTTTIHTAVLPAVADFLASLALIMAGEEDARAVIKRIEGRIEDWKAGHLPGTQYHSLINAPH